jgi:hypothetical protein
MEYILCSDYKGMATVLGHADLGCNFHCPLCDARKARKGGVQDADLEVVGLEHMECTHDDMRDGASAARHSAWAEKYFQPLAEADVAVKEAALAAKADADGSCEQQQKLDALAAAKAKRDEIGQQVETALINDGHEQHSLPGQPGNLYDLIISPLCFQSCGLLKQKHAQIMPVEDSRSLYRDVLANLQMEMAGAQQTLQKARTAEQQAKKGVMAAEKEAKQRGAGQDVAQTS